MTLPDPSADRSLSLIIGTTRASWSSVQFTSARLSVKRLMLLLILWPPKPGKRESPLEGENVRLLETAFEDLRVQGQLEIRAHLYEV